ncbi:Uncharacterised protein [uncultured archaeon]|nr:Uncharacterised protein [uncultured archaeon]
MLTEVHFSNMASLMYIVASVLLIAACLLLYSAHKLFKPGDVTAITISMLVAGIALLAARLMAVFDANIFQIQHFTFYRAVLAVISALAFLVFAYEFYQFAEQYGLQVCNVKKSKSENKIAKALGGRIC